MVLRAGCGIWLYQFLIIVCLFNLLLELLPLKFVFLVYGFCWCIHSAYAGKAASTTAFLGKQSDTFIHNVDTLNIFMKKFDVKCSCCWQIDSFLNIAKFLAHLSRRLTRWAYSIAMVRRPSVVVCRRLSSSSTLSNLYISEASWPT